MNETSRKNMSISGASTMPGGEYGLVQISGSGKVQGAIRAEKLSCSGAAKVEGCAVLGRLSCSGACRFEEDLTVTGKASMAGATKVEGSGSFGQLSCSGATKIGGNCSCKELSMAGVMKVSGGVEAETVRIDGAAEIGGLLNAEAVTIKGRQTSQIHEIGCGRLSVKKGRFSFWSDLFHPNAPALEADLIEADTAELKYVHAKLVRGKQLIIGKGCQIDRVEYEDTCEAAAGTVKETVKI